MISFGEECDTFEWKLGSKMRDFVHEVGNAIDVEVTEQSPKCDQSRKNHIWGKGRMKPPRLSIYS